MKLRTDYLSDEELEMLILDIEQTDMLAPPPDMAENIFFCVTEDVVLLSAECKKKEYRSYCFRVWTCVAAAIAMAFILPKLMSFQLVRESQNKQHETSSIEMQESLFAFFGDSNRIFDGEDRFDIFKERNGG